ncbi:MAG: hypothetical protein LBT30_03865 [Clostridiales bacterium]|jgi:hypothetical protein|nr:hypothetical protein [Clostridiales bacterium]
MKNFVKQNLHWLFFAGMGFLSFILLSIPYITLYVKGYMNASAGVNGYGIMSSWGLGFGGVMSSLFQLVIFLTGHCLLALGIVGFLKEFKVIKIPDKIGKFDLKQWGSLLLLAYAALNVLLLIFLIILCATNKNIVTIPATYFTAAYKYTTGYRLSAGIFMTIIFSAGAFAALYLLNKKYSQEPVSAPAEDGDSTKEI